MKSKYQHKDGDIVTVKSKITGVIYQGEVEMMSDQTFVLRFVPALKIHESIAQMNFGNGLVKEVINPTSLIRMFIGNDQYNDQKVYADYVMYPKSIIKGNYKQCFIGAWKEKNSCSTEAIHKATTYANRFNK